MQERRQLFGMLAALAVALALAGCSGASSTTTANSKAKVQQVRLGMTMQQVQQILGKPIDVLSTPPAAQIRQYQGYTENGGYHRIELMYDDGLVTRVVDMVHSRVGGEGTMLRAQQLSNSRAMGTFF